VVQYDKSVPGVKVVLGGVDPDGGEETSVFYYDALVSRVAGNARQGGRKRKAELERDATPTLRELLRRTYPNASTLHNLPRTSQNDIPITTEAGVFDKRGSHVVYSAQPATVSPKDTHLQVSSGFEFLITSEPTLFQHAPSVGLDLPALQDHEYFVFGTTPCCR
jgi:hypothetical protein